MLLFALSLILFADKTVSFFAAIFAPCFVVVIAGLPVLAKIFGQYDGTLCKEAPDRPRSGAYAVALFSSSISRRKPASVKAAYCRISRSFSCQEGFAGACSLRAERGVPAIPMRRNYENRLTG